MSILFNDPKNLKAVRINMWINQVLKNLDNLEKEFLAGNYADIKSKLPEQYRLLVVIWNVLNNKTRLDGWKVESK